LLTKDFAPCYLVYKLEDHPPQAICLGSRANWKLALDVLAMSVFESFKNGGNYASKETLSWRALIRNHTVYTPEKTEALLVEKQYDGCYRQGISFAGSPANSGNWHKPYWVDERGVPIDALDRWWLDEMILDRRGRMQRSNGNIQKEPLFHTLVLTSYMRMMLRHFPGVGFGFIREPCIRRSPKWQPDRPLHLRWHLANPRVNRSKYQGLEVAVRPAESLEWNADRLCTKCTNLTYRDQFHNPHEALWYCWAESIIELLHQLPTRPLASCFSLQQQVRVLDSLWQAASTVKRILSHFDWKVNRILIQ